jgi:hypothetical protein
MASFIVATLQEAQRRQAINNERLRTTSIPIPDDYNNDDDGTSGIGSGASSGGEGNEANDRSANAIFNSEAQRTNNMREAFSHWDSQRQRRRSMSLVVMWFFLLRLWMGAFLSGDTGLYVLCVALTTICIKVQQRRRAEDEAMLAHAVQRGAGAGGGAGPQSLSLILGDGTSTHTTTSTTTTSIHQFGQISARSNMSFQMQLTIAMMQRANGMMLQSSQTQQLSRGVPPEVQQQWKRFTLKTNDQGEMQIIAKQQPAAQNNSRQPPSMAVNGVSAPLARCSSNPNHNPQRHSHSSYSSFDDSDDATALDLEAGPLLDNNNSNNEQAASIQKSCSLADNILADSVTSCSICLSEYEAGEALVQLPCGHVYHDDCAKAWVERSVKCPLCNHNLDGTEEDKSST